MSSQEQRAKDMVEGRQAFPTSQSESISDATSSSLGWGAHGSGPVDKTERENTGRGPQDGPENANVDAEQVATFAEGQVADAVDRKSGTQKVPGETIVEDDYAGGLERKKQEQAAARQEIKDERKAGLNVDGSLGEGRTGTEDNSAV